TGTEWSLEGFEKRGKQGASDTALVAGTTITLSIGPDGRATGSAGVNRYFGKAEVGQDDRITFGRMASTRRGGPPEAMAQERTYLNQLSLVSSWAIAGDSLILTSKDGSLALRFGAK
ncbi:MAG: META domain-containing protein, partial [Verrucomicrobiota bacterium]|nr:META domain-containing protein [Verrucomicrobiota bacterium]